jgi:hypothetical protein
MSFSKSGLYTLGEPNYLNAKSHSIIDTLSDTTGTISLVGYPTFKMRVVIPATDGVGPGSLPYSFNLPNDTQMKIVGGYWGAPSLSPVAVQLIRIFKEVKGTAPTANDELMQFRYQTPDTWSLLPKLVVGGDDAILTTNNYIYMLVENVAGGEEITLELDFIWA